MKNLKIIIPYLISPILSLIILTFFFQLWKVDLRLPIFGYDGGDSLFGIFEAKSVVDGGWFFTNSFIGFPQSLGQFNLYDFPLQADSFHFFIIKVFSYFTSNPFLIMAWFFITSFALISTVSFAVLRSFNISNFSATIISILYAFTPYHFSRNLMHVFLGNYVAIPLVVMVSLWIISDKMELLAINKKGQFYLNPNRFFYIALAISLFVATNGIYYAFYACIIFGFSWFLRGLKNGVVLDRQSFTPLVLCGSIIFALLCLYLPSFLYWSANGLNSSVANRDIIESERFGLKIVNLFTPIANHYLEYFRNLRWYFDEIYLESESERKSESGMESLGIIAASGFLFLLLWLIVRGQSGTNSFFQKTIKKFSLSENDQNLISDLAGLNLISVLFATVGGFVMFVAMAFPLVRSHARFSIFIAFFSLFLVAIILDKIVQKKKNLAKIAVSIIFVLALFDQVGQVSAISIQNDKAKSNFISDQDFVQKIEETMPKGAMIFMLPVLNFPESEEPYNLLSGYLHSKELRWSYPAMRGRKSNLWQQEIAEFGFADFIAEIRKKGFVGIYIDRKLMAEKYSWPEVRKLEAQLKKVAKGKKLVSKNSNLVFFAI